MFFKGVGLSFAGWVIAAIFIAPLAEWLENNGYEVLAGILSLFWLAIPPIIAYFIIKSMEKDRLQRGEGETIFIGNEIQKHLPALLRNLHKSIKKNDYGAVISDKRYDVLLEFLNSINLPKILTEKEAVSATAEILEYAETQISGTSFNINSVPSDGYAFERWVADALSLKGWDAKVTRESGDQGIDIIAKKNGRSVGIQCKLYSSAVGNSAIQQAIAGKFYYNLMTVAVITNSSFTSSAKALAHSTDVVLMYNHDLLNPDVKLLSDY